MVAWPQIWIWEETNKAKCQVSFNKSSVTFARVLQYTQPKFGQDSCLQPPAAPTTISRSSTHPVLRVVVDLRCVASHPVRRAIRPPTATSFHNNECWFTGISHQSIDEAIDMLPFGLRQLQLPTRVVLMQCSMQR